MSELQESARRWSGYVCPDCRFVFRVPRDYDGKGLVCPSCRRLLRLPGDDEVLPPLVATSKRSKPSERGDPKAHARAHFEHAKPKWEREEVASAPEFRRKRTLAWVAVGTLIAIIGLGSLLRPGKTPSISPPEVAPPVANVPAKVDSSASGGEAISPGPPQELQAFRRETEAIAKRFLEAKSVAEIAQETPKPDQTAARAKQMFPDGKIDAPGYLSYLDGSLISEDRHTIVQIQTRYQGVKPLTFVRTDTGWKVDWESWSGWSEVTWADTLAQRPTKLVQLRATVSPVEYYNFYFTEEARWRSFRLESPDGEHVLYGYVERGSELEEQLLPPNEQSSARLVVDVRFPGDPSARNQVFISRIANQDWTDFDSSAGNP